MDTVKQLVGWMVVTVIAVWVFSALMNSSCNDRNCQAYYDTYNGSVC